MRLLDCLFARPAVITDNASHSEGLVPPEVEYALRSEEHTKQLKKIKTRHALLWVLLSGALLLSFALSYGIFSSHIAPQWIAPAAILFSITIESLRRNGCAYRERQKIAGFYELGIQRLQGAWQGKGNYGEEYAPTEHQYAADPDLFGEGSLFELLCTARTSIGHAKLAEWLLNPADVGEIKSRQLAVAELRDKLDLRESWASIGDGALGQAGSSSFREWASGPNDIFSSYAKLLRILLPLFFIALCMSIHMGLLVHYWKYALGVTLVLEAILALSVLKRTRQVASGATVPSFELGTIAPLIRQLEDQQFQNALLRSLQSRLHDESHCASEQIRSLTVLVWLLELRRFEYFALVSSVLLWGTNLAILIERWRKRNIHLLPGWLDALGQFEALLCLARHHYENPNDTFPVRMRSGVLTRTNGLSVMAALGLLS